MLSAQKCVPPVLMNAASTVTTIVRTALKPAVHVLKHVKRWQRELPRFTVRPLQLTASAGAALPVMPRSPRENASRKGTPCKSTGGEGYAG